MNNDNENYGGARPDDADNRNYGGETSANNSYSGAPDMSSEESLRDTGSDQSDWQDPDTDLNDEPSGAATGNERGDADSEEDILKDDSGSHNEEGKSNRTPGQLGNL